MLWALIGLAAAVPMSLEGQSLTGSTANSAGPSSPVVSMTPSPHAPDSFGPGQAILSIESKSFTPMDSSTTWTWDGTTGARIRTGGGAGYPWFDASVNLPSGAHVIGLAFEVYDNDASNDVTAWFATEPGAPAGTPWVFSTGASTTGQPGWTYTLELLNVTIDNFNNSYMVEVSLPGGTPASSFRRAMVYYTLQVSPAPGSATFGDGPVSDPAFQYIEALYASGITAGCAGGNYCPDQPLTRRQMAVFLSKALGLYWYY